MRPLVDRRLLYLLVLAALLVLWVAVGNSDAIEAPYVGF